MAQTNTGRWHGADGSRDRLIDVLGMEVVRFQEDSNAFGDVAARILAVDRRDLPCMTMLLFGGPASVDQLVGGLQVRRSDVTATIERLQLAGYARRRPDPAISRIELTEHAREWIERIWTPLRHQVVAYSGPIRREISRSCARSWRAPATCKGGRC